MDRQAEFRRVYRERIEPWYSGILHVATIYAIGLGVFVFSFRQLTVPITWMQWAVILVVAFVANVLEWAIHLYIMHRPRKNFIARAIYRRHTLMHHQFFTDKNYMIDSIRDFRIVFFPPYTEVVAVVAAMPGAFVLGWLLGANAGWLTILTVVSLYMLYELFHLCCHVRDNWFVRSMPFISTIRRHHIAHHEQSIMMHRNMNLTFPVADWLFGTSDLDRGFVGTVFNGMSGRFVRTDMARTTRTPKVESRPGSDATGGVRGRA